MSDLSVVILTLNEAKHIERAVNSVQPVARQVFVVDSGSTDGTCEIAERLGCVVMYRKWKNHATQFNWALDNCPIETRWVMRLDADEFVTGPLQQQLQTTLHQAPEDASAFRVPRRMHFLGRWVKHGGVGERMMLRIWLHGQGHVESRWMDEHTVVEGGRTYDLNYPIVDDNLNPLTWWISKHNNYASREAIDYLLREAGHTEIDADSHHLSGQAKRMRFFKHEVFYRLPPMLRGSLFFSYRYLFQLGFLDGVSGTYFHFFQAWWYRTLVDAKIFEVRKFQRAHGVDLAEAIRQVLGFDVDPG